MDFLSLGMDPEKSTFWIQSDVHQVAELTWILSVVTSVGLMERGTSYKDKLAKGVSPNMGLFSYPILMAADILLYGGEIVPVGKDQKQHLEMTRDIAIRFNNTFGDILVIPEPDIEKDTQTLIDLQPLLKQARDAGIGLIGMKAVRYLAPMKSLGKGDPSGFDKVYDDKFKASSLNPFQRAYAYVLEHGLDVVNADMQNFKHLEENITAAATSATFFGCDVIE